MSVTKTPLDRVGGVDQPNVIVKFDIIGAGKEPR
jgi:hypothetical protein